MEPKSRNLRGYAGPNPFHESQARDYNVKKLVREFFPTPLYLSLFNEQNEILVGTRGSGKTAILRMLTYSCIRHCDHEQVKRYYRDKSFIGFYVPMHLELVASMPGEEASEAERIAHFQFIFNCASCKGLLDEVECLFNDSLREGRDRLLAEARLADHLLEIWDPLKKWGATSVRELNWRITQLYSNQELTRDALAKEAGIFGRTLFAPIVPVLHLLTEALNLDFEGTNWVACIDEAEFLKEPHLKCINTALRSEKRPLVIKMATMPFKHSTQKTLVEGVSAAGGGNDYNYRVIDADCESKEFRDLCDHISKSRFSQCELTSDIHSLEEFIGAVDNGDLIDYFRYKLPNEATPEKVFEGIVSALSIERQKKIDEKKSTQKELRKPLMDKFAPVFYVRRMLIEEKRGNTKVGWYAGVPNICRVSDGNPRRFIQIMNAMVEVAREHDLTPENQHAVLMKFCKGTHESTAALSEIGPITEAIMDEIGKLLAKRVHGDYMLNGGCGFSIEGSLIEDTRFINALELALAFSLAMADHATLTSGITRESTLRLSYLYAVIHWLPMRKGDKLILRSTLPFLAFDSGAVGDTFTLREAKSIISQMRLEGLEEEITDD